MSGSSVWLRPHRPFKTLKLEIVERLLIKLMVVRTCACVCAKRACICTAVCAHAAARRRSRVLRQNNNLHLKGVVCSTHCWPLVTKTLDCVILFLVFPGRGRFSSAGQLFVCDSVFLGRRRTQVGNRLVAVIYGDLL